MSKITEVSGRSSQSDADVISAAWHSDDGPMTGETLAVLEHS